jgi:Helix-turn-helix domain
MQALLRGLRANGRGCSELSATGAAERRSATDVAGAAARVFAFVKSHPGMDVEVIGEGCGGRVNSSHSSWTMSLFLQSSTASTFPRELLPSLAQDRLTGPIPSRSTNSGTATAQRTLERWWRRNAGLARCKGAKGWQGGRFCGRLHDSRCRRHFTPHEVADWLRTTVNAVYAKAERGTLPGAMRVGRRLYFLRAELLGLLEQGVVPHLGGPGDGT